MKIFQKISIASHEKAMEKLEKRLNSQFNAELGRRLNDRDDIWRIEIEKIRKTPVSERREIDIKPNIQSRRSDSSFEDYNN